MRKIIIARHGESTANEKNFVAGRLDYPLSRKGVWQAIELAQEMSSWNIEKILASGLCRSHYTAKIVALPHLQKKNFEGVECLNGLGEVDYGFPENTFVPAKYANALEALLDGCWKKGENLYGIYDRAKETYRTIKDYAAQGDGTLVVIGHNTFNIFLRAVHEKIKADDVPKLRTQEGVAENGSYFELVMDEKIKA